MPTALPPLGKAAHTGSRQKCDEQSRFAYADFSPALCQCSAATVPSQSTARPAAPAHHLDSRSACQLYIRVGRHSRRGGFMSYAGSIWRTTAIGWCASARRGRRRRDSRAPRCKRTFCYLLRCPLRSCRSAGRRLLAAESLRSFAEPESGIADPCGRPGCASGCLVAVMYSAMVSWVVRLVRSGRTLPCVAARRISPLSLPLSPHDSPTPNQRAAERMGQAPCGGAASRRQASGAACCCSCCWPLPPSCAAAQLVARQCSFSMQGSSMGAPRPSTLW